MQMKTCLVTGATDGIGRQTALELARMGVNVIIHGRSPQKAAQTLADLRGESNDENLSMAIADFSSLAQVRGMAEQIKKEHAALEILINNAGNFYKNKELSVDGWEMSWAVNHLAPFLLTMLLLDLLKSNAPARIVTVASGAHHNLNIIDWENLQGEKAYDGFNAYALSKLASICCMNELARQLDNSRVTVNTLHPGVIDTKLLRSSYNLEGVSVEEGAQTSIYLATADEVEGKSGKYFSRKVEKPVSALAGDEQVQHRFWKISIEMVTPFL